MGRDIVISRLDFIQKAIEGSKISLAELRDRVERVITSLTPISPSDDFLYKLLDSSGVEGAIALDLGQRLFSSKSILDFTQDAVDGSLSTSEYLAAFIQAAILKQEELDEFERGSNDISKLRRIANPENPEFRAVLVRYKVFSWLLAVGLTQGISYDQIHQMNGYKFTRKTEPNPFIKDRINDIEGRRILTLGSANGINEKFLVENGAKGVRVVESSPHALSSIRSTRESIEDRLRGKLIVPDEPIKFLDALEQMGGQSERVDLVTGVSFNHYYDDTRLQRFIGLLGRCLDDGGELHFAIKAPGAILDGNGIPLIDQVMGQRVKRAYLNNDAQVRFFRDKISLEEIIARGASDENFHFEPVSSEGFRMRDYDVCGEQLFYDMRFRKKPKTLSIHFQK